MHALLSKLSSSRAPFPLRTYLNRINISRNHVLFVFWHIIHSIPFTSAQYKKFVRIILGRDNDGAWLTVIWKINNVHDTTGSHANTTFPFHQTFKFRFQEHVRKYVQLVCVIHVEGFPKATTDLNDFFSKQCLPSKLLEMCFGKLTLSMPKFLGN